MHFIVYIQIRDSLKCKHQHFNGKNKGQQAYMQGF